MLFLNTSGFEVEQNEEGKYIIYLTSINNTKLRNKYKIVTLESDEPQEFSPIDIIVKTKNINSYIECVSYAINNIICMYTVEKQNNDKGVYSIHQYSIDMSNSNTTKTTIRTMITLLEDKELTKSFLTLEDLLGPAFKDVDLYIASDSIDKITGRKMVFTKIAGIYPKDKSIFKLMENPKEIAVTEYDLVFAVDRIVYCVSLDYTDLLAEITKMLYVDRLSISNNFCDITTSGIHILTLYLNNVNMKKYNQ